MTDADFPDPEARHELAENCRRCPALAEARTRIGWGNGPRDADLVVVGEAPAAGDPDAGRWQGGNYTGMAYTSRHSGRQVRTLVAALDCGEAYYTNAVKCFPADPDDPTDNREPTAEERANCRPYLREEIETVDPRAVLATGKHATRSVLAAADRTLDGGFLDSVLDPDHSQNWGRRSSPCSTPHTRPSGGRDWATRTARPTSRRYGRRSRSDAPEVQKG